MSGFISVYYIKVLVKTRSHKSRSSVIGNLSRKAQSGVERIDEGTMMEIFITLLHRQRRAGKGDFQILSLYIMRYSLDIAVLFHELPILRLPSSVVFNYHHSKVLQTCPSFYQHTQGATPFCIIHHIPPQGSQEHHPVSTKKNLMISCIDAMASTLIDKGSTYH